MPCVIIPQVRNTYATRFQPLFPDNPDGPRFWWAEIEKMFAFLRDALAFVELALPQQFNTKKLRALQFTKYLDLPRGLQAEQALRGLLAVAPGNESKSQEIVVLFRQFRGPLMGHAGGGQLPAAVAGMKEIKEFRNGRV